MRFTKSDKVMILIAYLHAVVLDMEDDVDVVSFDMEDDVDVVSCE